MSPVTPADRVRALQRAGYRCEVVTGGRECPRTSGRVVRVDGRVKVVCLTHKHLLGRSESI